MTALSDSLAAAIASFHAGTINQAGLSAALAPIIDGVEQEAAEGVLDPQLVADISDLSATMRMRMLFGAESALAAAATTNLVDAATGVIHITGASTTITSFGPAPDTARGASTIRYLRFQNAQTITAFGGSIAVPAGGFMTLQGTTGTTWLLRENIDPSGTNYVAKTGLAALAGPIELVQSLYPSYRWKATSNALNEKVWDFVVVGDGLCLRAIDDAESTAVTFIEIRRNGTSQESITLYANGQAAMYLGSNVYIPGGQLAFPLTQIPSADPNTLDDYQEETFLPVLTIGGSSTGIVYASRGATVTKIGNRVSVDMLLILISRGGLTGNLAITGLPYTQQASGIVGIGMASILAGAGLPGQVMSYVGAGQAAVYLQIQGTTGTTLLSDAHITDSSQIYISVQYTV